MRGWKLECGIRDWMRYAHSFLTLSVPTFNRAGFWGVGGQSTKETAKQRKERTCIVQPVDAHIVVESKSSM